MRFIRPKIHGILDYTVAVALIAAPFVLGFASVIPAAVISLAGGVGLLLYSLVTDYSAGVRSLISFRLHLILDAVAAVALVAAPFLFGFAGIAAAFFWTVGVAVLAVVAASQSSEPIEALAA